MTDHGRVNIIFIIPGISPSSKNHFFMFVVLVTPGALLLGGNSSCLGLGVIEESRRRRALSFVCAIVQEQQFRVCWWSRKDTAQALCGSDGGRQCSHGR